MSPTSPPADRTTAAAPRSAAAAEPSTAGAAAATPVTRAFGRYRLLRLLGKSARSMSWLAHDPQLGQEVMLCLPRTQPADADALERWQREVRRAGRLNHPNLAPLLDSGVQDHWPYVVVERRLGLTLSEWLAEQPRPATVDMVVWVCQVLEGLAFAHEAGASHRDLQLHHILVNEQGAVQLMALGVASAPVLGGAREQGGADTQQLRQQRHQAERDVLAVGLLLHRFLAGSSPLDEDDIGAVIGRLPPLGRDIVRLPWTTPVPVPEALRAIANRATSAQERQRYLNARTLLRALNGWREVESADNGNPLTLLLDRLRTVGHLPATPGVGRRVARLSRAEGQRTDEIAEEILKDMALSFELLRQVNSALVQHSQAAGGAAVLTVRRAVALLGIDGVQRASTALRPWPGPLSEGGAQAMQRVIDRVRLAGHAAQVLRPAGYDPEVVYLVTVLQNLGRLLVQYHFPDEAEQLQQLMRSAPPAPGAEPGTPEQPGLSESAASFAVLGVDVEALGAAVARHWGLGDEIQLMMRRLSRERPVRTPDGDSDLLRTVASAANEAVDTLGQGSPQRIGAALTQVAHRYARVLMVDARDLKQALQQAEQALRDGAQVSSGGRAVAAGDPDAEAPPAQAPAAPNSADAAPSSAPPITR